MREIKFRAWSTKDKGFVSTTNYTIRLDGKIIALGGHSFNPEEGVILMQYTGLKDKNEKEIYEGDLIKRLVEKQYRKPHGKYSIQEIVYRNGMWILSYVSSESGNVLPRGYTAGEINNSRVDYDKNIVFYDGDHIIKEIEIIGNIHENSELLK